MKETLKKVAVALVAAIAASVGAALGELARDEIKRRFAPPVEPPKPARRRKARR